MQLSVLASTKQNAVVYQMRAEVTSNLVINVLLFISGGGVMIEHSPTNLESPGAHPLFQLIRKVRIQFRRK